MPGPRSLMRVGVGVPCTTSLQGVGMLGPRSPLRAGMPGVGASRKRFQCHFL